MNDLKTQKNSSTGQTRRHTAHGTGGNYYTPPQPPPFHDGSGTGTPSETDTLLALALLLDFLPHEQAHKLQHRFAAEVILQLPQGKSPLFLSRRDIMAWVNAART